VHLKDKDGALLAHVRDAGVSDYRCETVMGSRRDRPSQTHAVLLVGNNTTVKLSNFAHLLVRITTEPSRPRWPTIRLNFARLSPKSKPSGNRDEAVVRVSDIVRACKSHTVQQRADRWSSPSTAAKASSQEDPYQQSNDSVYAMFRSFGTRHHHVADTIWEPTVSYDATDTSTAATLSA